MKKSVLVFCAALTSLSLTAFGYLNWNNSIIDQEETSCRKTTDLDLIYNVDNRYRTTITKENLLQAKSIIDILPERATQMRESYQNVRISILHYDKETTEIGDSELLNTAQIKLLQSTDYSTNIRITSICRRKNAVTGELGYDSLAFYLTIIPEKEAAFTSGRDALIEYLKENSKEKTAIIRQDKLQPGKVNFTVTKKRTIANVKLTSTSGYPSVDKALIELISNMSGQWNPATNSKGKKVDQELVFFFGLEGC